MEKKPKIITINSNNSIIEGNLIELPFIYYSKTKDKPSLVRYEWINTNKEQCVIEIEGSVKHGVPTPYELDVLLALLRIRAKQLPIIYGNNLLGESDNFKKEDLIINFSLNDIAKELGKSNTGAILSRIKKAITILATTTITSTNTSAIYDITKKDYVTTENGNISHIVDSVSWRSTRTKNSTSDKNKIQIGEFFYKSICNSYFKYYNFEFYLSLGNNNVAKRMYLLLCKWRNSKNSQTLKLSTLYDRIPLEQSLEVFRKNEVVKNASKTLQKLGYIKDFTISGDKINFIFVSEQALLKSENIMLEKYNLFTEIQDRFLEIGFTQNEWIENVNFIVVHLEYIKALLRYVEFSNVKIANIKNFIKAGLTFNEYKIEEKYYNKK